MSVKVPIKPQNQRTLGQTSRHGNVPPRNPNKRPTTINMERSIGRMKANDMDTIRRAAK